MINGMTHTPNHGTRNEYIRHKCRCDACRQANYDYTRDYMERNPDKLAQHRATSKRWAQRNRDKREATRRAWIAKNPEKHAAGLKRRSERFRLKMYQLSSDEHARLLAEQEGMCAICRSPDNRALSVDHEHATHRIRGLLCRRCNLGLGCFGDDRALLKAADAYLKRG